VFESKDSSWNGSLSGSDASSSLTGLARFLDVLGFDFGLSVVCDIFLRAVLVVVVAFLAAAFGAAFVFGF